MKICSRCLVPLDDSCFRMRTEKRRNRTGEPFKYLNNVCKECEKNLAKARHQQLKDVPEYKELNKERIKLYSINNSDKIREQQKERRQTEKYKNNRKNYREKNREKILEQEKVCKRRYHEKNRDKLSNIYVTQRLIGKDKILDKETINENHDLIEVKRTQILLIRKIKTIQNAKK